MGNKFCNNCHNLCPDNKNETNLTYKKNQNIINNILINKNQFDKISQHFYEYTIEDENCSNKKINEIYKKNCLIKIIKNYRIYKNKQKLKIKNLNEIDKNFIRKNLIQDELLVNKENNNILSDFSINSDESNNLKTISEQSKESNKLSYFPQKIFNTKTVYKNIPQIKINNSRNNFNIKNNNCKENNSSSTVTKKEFSLTEEFRKNYSINNQNKFKLLKLKFDKLNSTSKTTFENSKEIESNNLIIKNNFK